MSLDQTKPTDQALNSLWPTYIRETRVDINNIWNAIVAANCSYTAYEMGVGEFSLDIGVDLENVVIETVGLTATVPVNLIQITGGSSGMIKIIKAGDGNVTIKHNTSYIDLLNDIDLTLTAGDMISLINIGGDPATGANGIWWEWSRSGAAVGEINTVSNVGSGAGLVYKQKTGVDFELKRIKSGTGIAVTNGVSDITIASTYSGSGEISYATVNMVALQTSLVTGVDLQNVINEIVSLTANVAVDLTTMMLGTAGAIKTIIAADSDVTIIQDKTSTTGGTFSMNAPAGVNINLNTGDVITFVNIGGDGVTLSGYWHELYRTLRV